MGAGIAFVVTEFFTPLHDLNQPKSAIALDRGFHQSGDNLES
jgi:hypothetical protein